MNEEQVTRLKEALYDAIWATIHTQKALPGAAREHAQDEILETMATLNAVWKEVKNQPADRQPTQGQFRRNIKL